MTTFYQTASSLAFLFGAAHSALGERMILIPLEEMRDIPRVFGSIDVTRRIIRFTWHTGTLFLWGIGGALWIISENYTLEPLMEISRVFSAMFFLCALLTLIVTHARYWAWIVFLVLGALTI